MTPTDRSKYWRTNLRLMTVLLTIWAVVGLGMSTLFVDSLNNISLGGIPFGFWMGQQGSIFTFVALIAFYVWRMEKLDESYGIDEAAELDATRVAAGEAS